ncbi:MAG: protein kinase [Pirellulales bacterium]|nr:protein kinase [Pirellulales bacterium]
MSAQAFLDLLEKSHLLAPERLVEAHDYLLLTADAEQFSQILIDQGWITGWQTEQLLAGRTVFFVGNYVLLELLGRGGMGSVYLARHTTMNREVALKVVSKKLGKDPATVERFLSEARASASLDHPNIVRAYDVGKDNDRFFIVMEYVPGHDLQELVDLEGPLPLEFAVDCIRQAAEGLAHAHGRNMVHCDVKPSNLLVNDSGVVKILDMGMARLMDERGMEGATGQPDQRVLGTVDFMAPEQALHGPKFDHRADVYSLGCTLFYLLTGRPPFDGGSLTQRILKHQTQPPPDVRQFRPDVPDDLAEICAKMMAKDPDGRYQTAREISRLMADWHPSVSTAPRAVPAPPLPETVRNGGVNLAAIPVPVVRRSASAAWPPVVWVLIGAGLAAAALLAVTIVLVLLTRPHPMARQVSGSSQRGQPAGSAAAEAARAASSVEPDEREPSPARPTAPAPSEPRSTLVSPIAPVPQSVPVEPIVPPTPAAQPPEAQSAAVVASKPEATAATSSLSTGSTSAMEAIVGSSPSTIPEPAKNPLTPPRPKPPRPKPDSPFAEFERAVDLPAAPRGGAASETPPHRLNPLNVRSPESCQIMLIGGATALVGDREFLLSRAPDAAEWFVRYRGSDGSLEPVARLWVKEKALWFAWGFERVVPADNLRLAALRVEVEGRSAVAQLQKPRIEEPLVINPTSGAGAAPLSREPAPEPEARRLVITGVEGAPIQPTFDPSETIPPDGRTEMVFATEGAPKVILRAEYPLRRRSAQLEVAAYYQMPDQTRRYRLNASTFAELVATAQKLEAREAMLAAQLANLRSETGRQAGSLKQHLANVRAQREQIRNLDAFRAALQGQIKIHYREYVAADGLEIELARTKP